MNRRLVVIAALCVAVLEAHGKNQEDIITAIKRERRLQENQWGGKDHDEGHDQITWLLILMKHLGKFARVIPQPISRDYRNVRESIIIAGETAAEYI